MYEKDLTPKQPMFEQTVTAFDLNGLFQLLTNLPDFHGTIIFTPSVSLGTSCARASGEPGSLVLSQAEAKSDNGSPIIAPTQQPSSPHLVTDLATEQAMVYWTRLCDAGILTDDYRLADGVSKAAAHFMVECFCRNKKQNEWLPFEKFWNLTDLRRAVYDFSKEQEEKISKVFREL